VTECSTEKECLYTTSTSDYCNTHNAYLADSTGRCEVGALVLSNDACNICGGAFGSREDALSHLRIDHALSVPSG